MESYQFVLIATPLWLILFLVSDILKELEKRNKL